MLSCRDTARLLTDTGEKLSLGRRIALRMHLLMCHLCRRHSNQLRATDEIARRFARAPDNGGAPVAPALSPASREKIRTVLRES